MTFCSFLTCWMFVYLVGWLMQMNGEFCIFSDAKSNFLMFFSSVVRYNFDSFHWLIWVVDFFICWLWILIPNCWWVSDFFSFLKWHDIFFIYKLSTDSPIWSVWGASYAVDFSLNVKFGSKKSVFKTLLGIEDTFFFKILMCYFVIV